MSGREKNNPGNYAADLWNNQQEQTRQATRKRRGKNGTVLINGVPFAQSTLFHGEELRAPFPDAPINKVPDRLGMTATPGTLFSRPTTEPQSTQDALFSSVPEKANESSHLLSEPAPAAQEVNPLLAILTEDEIYIDPFELPVEEAQELGYPLLRRDVKSYRWWLEFGYDVREDPPLYEALKKNNWRWGGYRKQWFNPHPFAKVPEGLYYGNAGYCSYSEERAERLETRKLKTATQATENKERTDRMAR